jgi:hypothetical protein
MGAAVAGSAAADAFDPGAAIDDQRLWVLRVTTTGSGSVLVPAPPGVRPALASAVARALGHLPDELLRAMAGGLRAHADELAPGVLFRGHRSGGCAVGVTLRELAPESFEFGRLRFWLWQRWRRGVERDVARRFPRLKHLQWYFDEAVAELSASGCEAQAARIVGEWLADSASAELSARRRVSPGAGITLPARRARRGGRTSGTRRGAEVSRWS